MKQRQSQGASFPIFPTRVLPTFLERMKGCEKPAILDIGPVFGSNIEFLAGQGMKVYVEDVLAGWQERNGQDTGEDGMPGQMEEYLHGQLIYPPKFFDGILCWDLLDAIDPLSARLLIRRLNEILKHEGTVLTLFGPGASLSRDQTKYVIVDQGHLAYGWASTRRSYEDRYENRQILEIFRGFTPIRAYQLQNQMREMLFRKVVDFTHEPIPNTNSLHRLRPTHWSAGESRGRR